MKKKLWLWSLLLLACLSAVAALLIYADASNPANKPVDTLLQSDIYISEICAKNESIIADNNGKYLDYIELYNSGNTINLAGFTLYDGKIKSAPLGDILLENGEYRLFFISRDETGFAISASGGDTIQLLDPSGRIMAQVTVSAMQADEVMTLKGEVYKKSFEASPGFSNDAMGIKAFRKGNEIKSDALVISEVLIENVSALPDENGIYCDIVELHNISEEEILLSKYFLSDNVDNRFKYRLPDVLLGAGSYVILYCDGENYVSAEGYVHTNFGLAHGEKLVLTAQDGNYTSVSVQYVGDDVSWSLDETGEYFAYDPTLGYSNDAQGAELMYNSRVNEDSALVINEVLLSSAGVPYLGSFCDAVEIINVSSENIDTTGWYLSDGGDPYEYPLPAQNLKPGEIMVIVCGPGTTGFSISEGETLLLTGSNYMCAPPVLCVAGETGESLGLIRSGDENAYAFQNVTLGYPNEDNYHVSYLKDGMLDDLRISEVMSNNQSYLLGAYQTSSDWIEFYNASDESIRLSDYYLSDRMGNIKKYQLPDKILEPGCYFVILLNNDTTNLIKGYDVIPENLSSEGETLYLSKNGRIVDYAFVPELTKDMSYGREKESDMLTLLARVTPGSENSEGVEKTAMPIAITSQGVYDDVEYVDVVLSGEGDIYYTTSCHAPSMNELPYTGPIRLTETTVLRVICYADGKLPSEILDLTYVINEHDNLPIVTIVTSPSNLWDSDSGIYVLGNNAEEEEPYRGANYWMPWEKPMTLSLFEDNGSGFSVKCGLRIFGDFTRMLDKKSLACVFRDTYGADDLEYPVFGENGLDTYETIILRTAGQDAYDAKMRDVLNTSLVGEYTDVPVQDYRPVVLYLNGEYWGIYYIREKLNEHYITGHYDIDADDETLVKLAGWTCKDYIELLSYAVDHDMTVQEHYDYLCSKINVDNYIDFYIAQMWIGNTDKGNVRYFLNEEGKWTWILYDTDISLRNASHNFVQENLNRVDIGPGDTSCKTFAVTLMANDEFKTKFLSRLAWQMNTIWTEENVLGRINEIESMIINDMVKEAARWNGTFDHWATCVEELRQYARERNGYMLQHIQEFFDLTNKEMRAYGFNV